MNMLVKKAATVWAEEFWRRVQSIPGGDAMCYGLQAELCRPGRLVEISSETGWL
jgi:hypothetical protein